MESRNGDSAARPRDPDRRGEASVVGRQRSPASAYREARQLELYVYRLRILERELADHRAANRGEAERETRETLERERDLIRRLCDEAGLELPPDLATGD